MKEFLKNLKFAWKYSKDQKKKMIVYIFCNIIQVLISVVVPIISAQIIVNLTNNMLKQVLFITIILMLVKCVKNLVTYFTSYFIQIIHREAFIKIQYDLGKEILKLENKSIDKNSSGVFIQRLTNDASRIADVFNVLNIYLTNIITNIGIFGAIFIINKIVFLYLIFMVLIVYLIEKKKIEVVNEKDKEFRKNNEQVSGFIGELVRGVRDIKMLNAEDSFMKELKNKVIDLNQKRYSMAKSHRTYRLLSTTSLDLFETGLNFLLVYLIYIKSISIASALVVHNYLYNLTSIIYTVSSLLGAIKDFNLSSTRIFEIIDSKEFSKEKFGTKHVEKINGDFEFKNVSFAYNKEERNILENINFKVNANETVAFVGKSGSGKSTIFSLLCKMYEIDEGEITIDGINIKELDKQSIRNNITIISQNPYIFNLSIKDNLRLVKEDATDEEIEKACKMACLSKFINKLPDGYDTIVGEGGVNLSGGERQRLAIARALIQKTEIILFDEATSALDNETQSEIQKAIENLQKDYTILIIAHRLSTVINTDRILFLDDGVIQGEGTHDELLKNNENYKLLYEAELNK